MNTSTTPSPSTTAPTPKPRSSRSATRRLSALAKAETRQFFLNKTLVFMALVFPLGISAFVYFLNAQASDAQPGMVASLTMETFLIIVLVFVQFYSVLSMATTRRDERVLKRLRTGEARDGEILTALASPSAVITVLLTAIITVALIVLVGQPPKIGVLTILAMLAGIIITTALALLTSAFTLNAEAAQMTSLPVIALALVSQSNILGQLPERVQDIMSYTPFALITELVFLDWNGEAPVGISSGMTAADGASILAQGWLPAVMLIAWAGVLLWISVRTMKWESDR